MFTASMIFTSFVALNVLLASIGQGQVKANVLRRGIAGHGGRQAHVIQGLIAGRDESFNKRQTGCNPCPDGIGCCPTGQTCDHLKDGSPTCCCTIGGSCNPGSLPCASDPSICCPDGDLCTSNGGCTPIGSGGGGSGGSGGGGSGGSGGGGSGGSSGGSGGGSGGSPSGFGGGSGGSGNSGGFGTITSFTPLSPTPTFASFSSSLPTIGGGLGDSPSSFAVTPVVTVTASALGSGKNGEVGLRAGTAVVMMGSVIVASGLVMLVF